jgi:hypothetical protein
MALDACFLSFELQYYETLARILKKTIALFRKPEALLSRKNRYSQPSLKLIRRLPGRRNFRHPACIRMDVTQGSHAI